MSKILMVNVPYAGHTNPTLPLAKALVDSGHEVGYINAPEWKEKIALTGAAFIPYTDYPDGLTAQGKKTYCFYAAYQTTMKHGGNYDLLIYEMLFYPGKTASDRLGIPCVRQFSQPAWNEEMWKNPVKYARMMRFSSKLIDMQMMGRKTAQRMQMEGKSMFDSILHDKPALNIVYLLDDMQPARESFDESYLFVPPPIPVALPNPDIDFAIKGRPIIYISLGSIISSRAFCNRCIKAFGNKDVTVIMATGRIPPESLGRLPENIEAYSFAPQTNILEHADLFITHGGMNSVNEALYFGVPMLVLPVINDQLINASRIESIGVGVRKSLFTTTAAGLFDTAMSVLADASINKKSEQLRKKIAEKGDIVQLVKVIENIDK